MKRIFILSLFISLLSACSGGSESGSAPPPPSSTSPPAPTTPQQSITTAPPKPEKIEGLAVGDSANLGNGALILTIDGAYKVTPRQGTFSPGRDPNWSFFHDLQRSGDPALLITMTGKPEVESTPPVQINLGVFLAKDQNGYTLPQIVVPPAIDPEHPGQGWQGPVSPGQTRGATLGKRVPSGQDRGLTVTYQLPGPLPQPSATWELGDLQALPEAPIP